MSKKIIGATVGTNMNPEKLSVDGSGNVFAGDENTTAAEFATAYQEGKVCFMRRPQGGSGITTWVAYNCHSGGAAFYHVNSTGIVEYGRLTSDGSWSYTAASGGGASIELDTTLTQPGKAADAKAVGDRLTVLESATPSGSGGISITAKNLLLTILRAAFYSSDQTSNIAALGVLLESGGSSGGGGDTGGGGSDSGGDTGGGESGNEPTNPILAIDGDVYAVQRNAVLCITPGGNADVGADGDVLSVGSGVLVHKQTDTLTIY